MTALSSVMVRITGNALIAASVLCVWWLLAAATGPKYFEFVDWLIRSWVGDLVMFGSVWALWFHLGGGLRHLIWDAGYCLDVDISEKIGLGHVHRCNHPDRFHRTRGLRRQIYVIFH